MATGADPTDTADATGSANPDDPQLTVERTVVVGGDGGTVRVVLEFDGALPGGEPVHVAGITDASGDTVSWTTQDPDGVEVCSDTHWFPEPAEGTVDLLIPAAWFAVGDDTHTSPLETIDDPAKFVVCGHHEGLFQYSIWGPVSADPDDVTVTVDPDRTASPSTSCPDPTPPRPPSRRRSIRREARGAGTLVAEFLDDLRRGDTVAAADRWAGYPELGPPVVVGASAGSTSSTPSRGSEGYIG